MLRRSLVGAALLLAAATPAAAAPPPNDVPGGSASGLFLPYTADNGVPTIQQATAELVEATSDPGVPRCLGPTSFARTVWYRLPESQAPTQLTLEATGRTLDVVDLAAFVQPEVVPEPTPVPSPTPAPSPSPPPSPEPTAVPAQVQSAVAEPNACDGRGAGSSDATEEPTSAVTLRVPARHPVLFQVGRRGTRRSADDERAYLALDVAPLPAQRAPSGDAAGSRTPTFRSSSRASLAGSTITGEDPAEPPCPSLGTVWRRYVPPSNGRRLVSVSGSAAHTLTVFAGRRPSGDNVLDCVNRAGSGALQLNVPVTRRKPLWIRVGADETSGGERATVRVTDGTYRTVVDGGPGGFDPTPGGPGGGLPSACDKADVTRARIAGARIRGSARGYRGVVVGFPIRVRGASVCDAELRLYGPRGAVFAKGYAVRLAPGRAVARLNRLRSFKAGSYRLDVKGVDLTGKRVAVRTSVKGRLGR